MIIPNIGKNKRHVPSHQPDKRLPEGKSQWKPWIHHVPMVFLCFFYGFPTRNHRNHHFPMTPWTVGPSALEGGRELQISEAHQVQPWNSSTKKLERRGRCIWQSMPLVSVETLDTSSGEKKGGCSISIIGMIILSIDGYILWETHKNLRKMHLFWLMKQ